MLSLHCTGWQVAGESVICECSVTATREGSPYPFGGIETASNTVSRICNCYLLLGIRGNVIDKRFPKSNSPLLQESQECDKKENLLHAAWLNSSLSGRSPFCQLRHDMYSEKGVTLISSYISWSKENSERTKARETRKRGQPTKLTSPLSWRKKDQRLADSQRGHLLFLETKTTRQGPALSTSLFTFKKQEETRGF